MRTMGKEIAQRQLVVETARTWLGTPFHHYAGVKRVGVDCAFLLARVFEEAGLIAKQRIPAYPADWHIHREAERYLAHLIGMNAGEIKGPPKPGDIVIFRFANCFSHGAIVESWPTIIHSYVGRRVERENVERAQWLNTLTEGADKGKPRPMRFFSYWAAR